MGEKSRLCGELLGNPFIASIDKEGTRTDKQNCALVVNSYHIAMGYRAYILDTSYPEEYAKNILSYCPNASVLCYFSGADDLCDGDVIDVTESGNLHFAFQASSADNVLFITNQCNSNCIMCPDSNSNRRRKLGNRLDYILQLLELIPSDTNHITITGGEPTMLKWNLLRILCACRNKFPETDFLMLTNGRTLCDKEYQRAFLETTPHHFRIAVPLYGTTEQQHDEITRAPGSFRQTMAALAALQHYIDIEIRVVVMKQNYQQLSDIGKLITKELFAVKTVSLMGLELLGNAANNRNLVWVNFEQTTDALEKTAVMLLSAGIDVRIYNYPLCNIPRNLWGIAAKSITDYKVRYQENCSECRVKELCGGFFFSTLHFEEIPVYPVLKGWE